MTTRLSVTVIGQAGVDAVLKNLEQALDTVQILDEAGAFLFNRIRTRYLQQVNPDGTPWVQSGAAKKRARTGRGGGTLFDTGRLFRSLQLAADGPDARIISTDVPYAARHNNGTDGQLQRVFLGFSEQDATLVTSLLIKRIKKALA
jgi:phage gpG-like protein